MFSAVYSEICVIRMESGIAAVLHQFDLPALVTCGLVRLSRDMCTHMPHRSLTPYQKTNAKGLIGK